MKVAINRPGKLSRSKQSRSNVPPKYASARRFFARLASEIFLTSLQIAFFSNLQANVILIDPHRLCQAIITTAYLDVFVLDSAI